MLRKSLSRLNLMGVQPGLDRDSEAKELVIKRAEKEG